jgi:TRAP-type C4-dicarboxylate transport system permease small subunit
MAEQGPKASPVGGTQGPAPWWRSVARALKAAGNRIWNGKAQPEAVAGAGATPDVPAVLEEGAIAAVEFPDTRFGRFDRRYMVFTKWLSYLAGIALLAVVVICVVDVLGWKLFGKPVPSSTDFIQYMNVALVFLAVAYVQTDRGSTSIELMQSHLPRWLKVMVRTFSYFLGFACCMFVVYRGWFLLAEMRRTHDVAAGVWKFPLWPFQVCLLVGCFSLGWAFVVTGIRDLINLKRRRGAYAPVVKKARTKTAVPPASE